MNESLEISTVSEEPLISDNSQALSAPTLFHERRRARRARTNLQVRVRPYSFSEHLLEEVRATADFSRSGLSFITRQRSYQEGMHLYVACPYSPYHAEKDGELARVVRVEERNQGRWEVAVEFVGAAGYNPYHHATESYSE